MKRRLLSVAGVVLLATTIFGFRPPAAQATPAALSMHGPVTFATAPPVTGPWCTSLSFAQTWLVSTTGYAGPMPVIGSGNICGTIPGTGNGSFTVTGIVNVPGVLTASMTCNGSWSGLLPGTLTFHLDCILTVTTPFGTTSQTICADGVVTFVPYLIGVLAGAGVSPC